MCDAKNTSVKYQRTIRKPSANATLYTHLTHLATLYTLEMYNSIYNSLYLSITFLAVIHKVVRVNNA